MRLSVGLEGSERLSHFFDEVGTKMLVLFSSVGEIAVEIFQSADVLSGSPWEVE